MTKKKDDGINININKDNLKKEQCSACLGVGKVNKNTVRCPVCGGSGSKKDIAIMPDFVNIQKGKPQNAYEITVVDTDTNKVIYKKKSFAGVMVTVEDLLQFTGKVTEGNFQSAFWGNPLIQRFAIDRLEETYAKNIDNYLVALENAGVFYTNKEEMKDLLVKGSKAKLLNIMQKGAGTDANINHNNVKEYIKEKYAGVTNTKEAMERFLTNAKAIMEDPNPFICLAVSQKTHKDAIVEVVLKGLPLNRIVTSALEFVATSTLKETNIPHTTIETKKVMLKIIEEIADTINKSLI